jgi:hypothetical protein
MFLCDSAVRCGVRGEMKLLDVCVIVLVSVFYLSRLPSPLRSLKADLIAKSRLTILSAVCQLVVNLAACDYLAARLSPAGANHPERIALEIAGWLFSGFPFGPVCRFFYQTSSPRSLCRLSRPKPHYPP